MSMEYSRPVAPGHGVVPPNTDRVRLSGSSWRRWKNKPPGVPDGSNNSTQHTYAVWCASFGRLLAARLALFGFPPNAGTPLPAVGGTFRMSRFLLAADRGAHLIILGLLSRNGDDGAGLG
jgi:hypothetical protein